MSMVTNNYLSNPEETNAEIGDILTSGFTRTLKSLMGKMPNWRKPL
jgi:hypothetical protein